MGDGKGVSGNTVFYTNVSANMMRSKFYVHMDHDMSKQHYISFIAAVSSDRVQMVKLYPEGNAEARFKRNGVKKLYFYCNRDGLFCAENFFRR